MTAALNKAALIEKIVAVLDTELATYAKSARAAHEEATHEQNKAEGKYDTRGLEASYLAQGQGNLVMETLKARQEFAALKPRDFGKDDPIDIGALVEIESPEETSTYFIGPRAGGTEITHQQKTILVITPQSPLGSQLIGRKQGNTLEISIGRSRSKYRITKVI
ncbi:MAG: GreA/GreB family elongation factor [Chthoniobacteraceae bacterium]